ncbi:MAG TPA: HAMP domain-containing sensor histidine kinase [Nitriliruptorales bacterium]|nr:HAMP domain-containing sensor histidine kinase [Nitriliruptorales bacterium]
MRASVDGRPEDGLSSAMDPAGLSPASLDPSTRDAAHPDRRQGQLQTDGERNPRSAGRVAAVLFAVAGLVAFASAATPGSRPAALVVIGTVDLLIAGLAWWAPWDRLGRRWLLGLALAALAIISGSMWVTGSEPVQFVPFFVLLFVWIGLCLPPWTGLWLSPTAAIAYVAPLVATGAPAQAIGFVVVVMPVAVVVAEVIARQVAFLQDALEQVGRSERWRADLMWILAHDVRSPLTAVEGALELLDRCADRLDEATRRKVLDAAFRQTRRIRQLATGLLDLDRVESGALRIDRQAVELARAAKDAAGYVGDADIRVAVEPGVSVWADADRLEQVLVNLISNALVHGRPPVDVTAETSEGRVEISVRDHGPGVPPDAQQALFEPFSHAETTHGSVGLGLWIARQLVEAHGGAITYESAHPGARFVVRLPQPANAPPADPGHLTRRHIKSPVGGSD